MTVLSPVGMISVHAKQCELIERPKQKVKLYQYAWLSKTGYKCTVQFFKDDEYFLCWLGNLPVSMKTGITSAVPFKRLDHTMIEVES